MPASTVVMVRPLSFCSNPETSDSNHFQNSSPRSAFPVVEMAQQEFDQFQQILEDHQIGILKFSELSSQNTPDALFPNNWFCHMPDGRVFLFPMYASNRRQEYRQDIIDALGATGIFDLRHFALEGAFLEGTGSLIFDHDHKIAYACVSARTSSSLLQHFQEKSGYDVISFESFDQYGRAIYHTNVMMALGRKNVIINLSSIKNENEQTILRESFAKTGKTIIDITHEQMRNFAGNMLLLQNKMGDLFWAGSSKAHGAFTPEQRKILEKEGTIIHSPLDTIETYGGGGARCLMAEVWT